MMSESPETRITSSEAEQNPESPNFSGPHNMDVPSLKYLPPSDSPAPHVYSSSVMSDYSHSLMVDMNIDKLSDWNKHQLQIKQLRQDLESERDLASQSRKKLNNVEIEKLELASKMNAEIISRDGEIARLRSLLEKSEAMHQNLEFELLRARQDLKQNSERFAEWKMALEAENQKLKEDVSKLSSQLGDVHNKLTACEQKEKVFSFKYKTSISEKESFMSHLRSENENLKTERDQLQNSISNHQTSMRDMVKKVKEVEDLKAKLDEQLAKTQQDLSLYQDREATLKRDLHTAFGRIKSLEGTVEAERASHLETKFNSEVIQLHVQELEKAVEMEQGTNKESKKNLNQVNKQLRELLATHEEEKATSYKYKSDMLRLQEQFSNVQNKLTSDSNDKKSVIQTMSKELEMHLRNFNKLKDELGKAKKRQVFMEEMYGGCMRELEVLLQNFRNQPHKSISDGSIGYSNPCVLSSNQMSYEPNSRKPAAIMESLRHTLMDLSRKLNSSTEDNLKMKSVNNTFTKEVSTYKQIVLTKDQALEESQTNYTKCAKELNRLRTEFRQLEEQTLHLKVEMESCANSKDKEKVRIKELSAEVMKLVTKHKKEDEDKLSFLHSVYQRLLAGRVLAHPKETTLGSFSWFDLTLLINEQITSVVTAIHKADEKIHSLEESAYSKESSSCNMQQSYEGQMSRMMNLSKDREASWRKQKKEIETHYEHRLAELQEQFKKKLAASEDVANKERAFNEANFVLETNHEELQQKLNISTSEHSRLQIVCSLLCGALYPLYIRSIQLVYERHLLEDMVDQGETTMQQLHLLIETLNDEMQSSGGGSRSSADSNAASLPPLASSGGGGGGVKMQTLKMSPIMRFRKYAILVLAANRLCFLSRTSKKLFSTYDVALGPISLIVQTMTVTAEQKTFAECLSGKSAEKDHEGSRDLLQLISNEELVQSLTNSVVELERLISTSSQNNESLLSFHSLMASARSAMSCITNHLAEKFQGRSYWISQKNFSHGSSLCHRLRCGLTSHISGKKMANYSNLLTHQKMIDSLQSHIVQFTKQFQVVECERRSLKGQLDRCLQEKRQLVPNQQMVMQLQEQLGQLHEKQQKQQKQVPVEKFEKMVQELKMALVREKQADKLLNEQAGQLQRLASQLETHVAGGTQKENTLAETRKNLNECQSNLKKREQTVCELKTQLSQFHAEKMSLQQNLKDAENTLRTASRDKIALQKYLKSVQETFNQIQEETNCQKSTDPCSSLPLLLKADHIPSHIGKAGPELIACQNLVKSFVDGQHEANQKICILEGDCVSMRQHIASLKKEFCSILQENVDQSNDFVPLPNMKASRKDSTSSKGSKNSTGPLGPPRRMHGEKPTLKSGPKLKSSLKQSHKQ